MEYNEEFLIQEITGLRRYLHMYPEKGFLEYRTSKFIADYLKDLGMDVITGVQGTGVIGVIKGNPGENSVAIRADMDCLEVDEKNEMPYCSTFPGLMHACGHDGHIAAALGLAKYLSVSDTKLKNNVIFVFQPAEEGPGGAKPIVESGILNKFNIKAFLAMHIFPEIEQGRIGCCRGPLTARNGEIDILVVGKSCHGALPQLGVDSIIASSEVILAFQSIISRSIDPRDSAVVTIGKINGGEARNIIAGQVLLEGTIRAFSKEVYDSIKNRIIMICEGISIANDCKIEVEIRDMYPEVFNDEDLYNTLTAALGKENVDTVKPLMIAEDFSYYRRIAPLLMFLLGSRNDKSGYIYPLHSSKFNFDEMILLNAIQIYKKMIESLEL